MNDIDLKNIERRTIILDKDTFNGINYKRYNRQWGVLAQVIRREILVNPAIIDIVLKYIGKSLKEGLAKEFLNDLSVNEKISSYIDKYRDEIIKYLELKEVPDEQIEGDLRSSTLLITPEIIKELYKNNHTMRDNRLKECIQEGIFMEGMTNEEKAMVANRYAMARDVKLLALSAELADNKDINLDKEEIVLDSGVVIYKNSNIDLDILDSKLWKNRKQIKDRVYEVNIGDKKYILKERKTSRHTDTFKNGHQDGLTSKEEFDIANYFKENLMVEDGEIIVNWEKPIASVLFPDGFQFTLFEYEEGLVGDEYSTELTNFMYQNEDIFKEEYESIKNNIDKYIDSDRISISDKTEGKMFSFFKKVGIFKDDNDIFRYRNYVRYKSIILREKAEEIMRDILLKHGYLDNDKRDFLFKFKIVDGKFKFEIFGIDFEYIKKLSKKKQDILLNNKDDYRKGYLDDDFLHRGNYGMPLNAVQQAGGIALEELYKK